MRFPSSLLSLLALLGCSQEPSLSSMSATSANERAEDALVLAPDSSRLLERSRELWQHKQAGDWIQVYDFYAPEYKRARPLGKFLAGREYHLYEDASEPLILKIDEDRGFVEIHVQWTPTHPILGTVDNSTGPLTQILDEVDEWLWSEGEWWLARNHRLSELRRTHPYLWKTEKG